MSDATRYSYPKRVASIPLRSCKQSAIHQKGSAGNPGRFRSGEIDDCIRDVSRQKEPPERHPPPALVENSLGVGRLAGMVAGHRSIRDARTYAIYPNSVF